MADSLLAITLFLKFVVVVSEPCTNGLVVLGRDVFGYDVLGKIAVLSMVAVRCLPYATPT